MGTESWGWSRWRLAPPRIAQLDVAPFIERVTSRRDRSARRGSDVEAVWEKAGMSIGCDGVPGVDHEEKIMVEGLGRFE